MTTSAAPERAGRIEADRAWLDDLIRAPGPHAAFVLHGAQRGRWETRVLDLRWAYLKRQGVRAAFLERYAGRMSSRPKSWRKSGQPAPPQSEDWRTLQKAAARLLTALEPFVPTRPREKAHLPGGWWDPSGDEGRHQRALAGLRDRAEEALAAARRTGRPSVDPDALLFTRLLLGCYEDGFGREPSAAPGGPTVRFVWKFFEGVAGEWCAPVRNPTLLEDGLPSAERFETARLVPETMPTLVESAIEARAGQEPAELWLGDMEGLFPRPFRRPPTPGSAGVPRGVQRGVSAPRGGRRPSR